MSRTPARFTQADLTRALRAAKQQEAARVEIRPDGTIIVHFDSEPLESRRAYIDDLADDL